MRDGRDRLLPIWLDVGPDEIAESMPLLLGRVALKGQAGVAEVARQLAEKIHGTTRRDIAASAPERVVDLYPNEIAAQALPHSFNPPLDHGETGFVFRTVTALRLKVDRDAYLSSEQKRAFQAILADSDVETLIRSFVDLPLQQPGPWQQAQPSTSTTVTVTRTGETMGGRGGSVEARAGMFLRFYLTGSAHAVIHLDLVLRPPEEMRNRSLLSLDDFFSLLLIPPASVRREVAPVMSALLADAEYPTFVAQSLVAMPQNDDLDKYLDLSPYANDRVSGATGPTAVHWNAKTTADFADPAWRVAVLRMIDRLFSDGSFLDYEHTIESLASSKHPRPN